MTQLPRLHVSLVAVPETSVSTMFGLYDLLNGFRMMAGFLPGAPETPPFKVEIVGHVSGQLVLAGGTPAHIHRGIAEINRTDIVVVPTLITTDWKTGRYPELVDWLKAAHEGGAMICSACSGAFLIAETGLLDGQTTTIHWNFARQFEKLYPAVPLSPEKPLVVAGNRQQFASSGASMSWHDLALYLVARHVGPAAAQGVAKFFALQWHRDGLSPYITFEGRVDHGDAAVLAAQNWLSTHYQVADPVEEAMKRSGLAERTFKRRFTNATGHAPLDYVQRLRVEQAKQRLECSGDSVDEIGWQVGYEEPAFFRRLFKRITGLSPSAYRRQFQFPTYLKSLGGP